MSTKRVVDVVAAGTGVVAVVLLVAGMALGSITGAASDPNPTQTGEQLAEALVANRSDGRLGAYLVLVAAFLLLPFVGRLAGHLRRGGEDTEWIATTVLGGGAVLVALLLVDTGFILAATELESYGPDPAVAKTLFLYGWNSAFLYAAPLAVISAGTTVVAFTHRLFSMWVRWVSAAFVVIMLLAFLGGVPGMATGVGLVWVALASVVLAFTLARMGGSAAHATEA